MERPFEGRLQVPQQVPKDMESEADELYVKEGRHPGVGGKEGVVAVQGLNREDTECRIGLSPEAE